MSKKITPIARDLLAIVLLHNKRENNRIPDRGVWFIYPGLRDDRVYWIGK